MRITIKIFKSGSGYEERSFLVCDHFAAMGLCEEYGVSGYYHLNDYYSVQY